MYIYSIVKCIIYKYSVLSFMTNYDEFQDNVG